MASTISKEAAAEFISYIREHEPYPVSILDDLMFDDNRYDDRRLSATIAMKVLLDSGFTEEEVNPWKKN